MLFFKNHSMVRKTKNVTKLLCAGAVLRACCLRHCAATWPVLSSSSLKLVSEITKSLKVITWYENRRLTFVRRRVTSCMLPSPLYNLVRKTSLGFCALARYSRAISMRWGLLRTPNHQCRPKRSQGIPKAIPRHPQDAPMWPQVPCSKASQRAKGNPKEKQNGRIAMPEARPGTSGQVRSTTPAAIMLCPCLFFVSLGGSGLWTAP